MISYKYITLIDVYIRYSSPRKNVYYRSTNFLEIELSIYRLLGALEINLAVDGEEGAEDEAEDEDEDRVVEVEEADQWKRRKTLRASEHTRKSTNLVAEREDTTRKWARQALVHQRKVSDLLFFDDRYRDCRV